MTFACLLISCQIAWHECISLRILVQVVHAHVCTFTLYTCACLNDYWAWIVTALYSLPGTLLPCVAVSPSTVLSPKYLPYACTQVLIASFSGLIWFRPRNKAKVHGNQTIEHSFLPIKSLGFDCKCIPPIPPSIFLHLPPCSIVCCLQTWCLLSGTFIQPLPGDSTHPSSEYIVALFLCVSLLLFIDSIINRWPRPLWIISLASRGSMRYCLQVVPKAEGIVTGKIRVSSR